MKIVIPNRDVDDPAETKEIAPVELDLEGQADFQEQTTPDFSAIISRAAADQAAVMLEDEKRQKLRDARAEFAAGQKALADRIKAEKGVSVGYGRGWTYEPKPKAAYELWKRVVPMFIERPETLELGPTKLVKMLAPNEPNYPITRDLFYDKLNKFAVADLKRMLRTHGISLKLTSPVTIRSIQNHLKQRRDAASPVDVETFFGRFEIREGTVKVNGKPYKIQLGSAGQRRIQFGRRWLPLDVLKQICLETAG